MGRQNKERPKDIVSKERKRNDKKQRRMETICCCGKELEKPVEAKEEKFKINVSKFLKKYLIHRKNEIYFKFFWT